MKKPVEITWVDSHSPGIGPWVDIDAINHSPLKIKSIGYVINESKSTITLASSIAKNPGDTSQASGVMCIPKCSIISTT